MGEHSEKSLEIWFTTSSCSRVPAANHDLRRIPRDLIDGVVNLVNGKVLEQVHSSTTDGYAMSESSLFVFASHLVWKVWSQATVLHAVRSIVELAGHYCGLDVVDQIFYSRRRFLRVDRARSLQKTFEQEVAYLDSIFHDGCAYVLGRTNVDCWYLYTLNKPGVHPKADQTLELIMTDLNSARAKNIYVQHAGSSPADAIQTASIDQLCPHAQRFDHRSDSCGYSINGLVPDGHYFTVHIAPESDLSHVRFETNVGRDQHQALIDRLLHIFDPGKFTTSMFTDAASLDGQRQQFLFADYARVDQQIVCLADYDLVYNRYSRHST